MNISVRDSKSLLGFSNRGGGSWKVWDRFITVGGKDAYHIGNICGTCAFFFQRLNGANQSLNPEDFQKELTAGVTELTDDQATLLSQLLPDGDYRLSLLSRVPHFVAPGDPDDYFCREQPKLWGIDGFWGLPHDPRTKYYRGEDRPLDDRAHLYEFFIPMFPEGWLDSARVSEFERDILNGRCPTALAISVLDVKQPADWNDNTEVTCHWCLAHYIIDGHHKIFAAQRAERPVSIISMLALDRGISSPEDHAKLAEILKVQRSSIVPSERR
jgi:hypothetical protein